MSIREVVTCAHGHACTGESHGWDCPLSDPMGDMLRAMMPPDGTLPNPILERARRDILAGMGVPVTGHDDSENHT